METAGQPPVADSVFMNDVFGAVVGEHFIFPAVDTPKVRTYPWVFPVFIERLLTARGQAAFDCTIR